MPRKKKRIKSKLNCGYCKNYHQALEINRLEKYRICLFGHKITMDSPRCDSFIPAKYFICTKYNFQTSYDICINRQINSQNLSAYKYCKRCYQFKTAVAFLALEL